LDYIELKINCHEDFREILQAEMAEAGFASFSDTETGFDAYAEPSDFDKDAFDEVVTRYHKAASIKYELGKVPRRNWNKEWESNYEPIFVSDRCVVRATFHEPMPQYAHEIIITPKMSFGTGHHQTTRLMLRHQLEVDHQGKRVLDVGCGTGILAILAGRLGAAEVKACDIDEWAVENSRENFELNSCSNIEVRPGTLQQVSFEGTYDIILANINKNVLLEEMETYMQYLKPQGILFLSGFYEADVEDLMGEAAKYKLKLQARASEKSWTSLVLSK
jgi:ribosomal protein L11 methyltransferase